jgi:hypothetical protein
MLKNESLIFCESANIKGLDKGVAYIYELDKILVFVRVVERMKWDLGK